MVVILDRYCATHNELCDLIDDLEREEDQDQETEESDGGFYEMCENQRSEFSRQPSQVEEPKEEIEKKQYGQETPGGWLTLSNGERIPDVKQRPGEGYRSYVARQVKEVEAIRLKRRGF